MHPSPGPPRPIICDKIKRHRCVAMWQPAWLVTWINDMMAHWLAGPFLNWANQLGHFLNPYQIKAHQKDTLKIESINSIQFLIPYIKMIITAQNTYQILAAQNKRYNLMFTLKRDTTAQNTHQQHLQHQKSKHQIQVAIWFQKQRSKCSRAPFFCPFFLFHNLHHLTNQRKWCMELK